MNEKSLLSLREIARELNLNYRIVVNYKNQIQSLLPGRNGGQFNKYPPECKDLFSLVAMLREEGYTFEMIRKILTGQEPVPDDDDIKEWVASWVSNLRQINPDQSGLIQTDPDQSRLIQTNLEQLGLIQINPDQSELVYADPDHSRPIQINPDQSGSIQTDPNLLETIQNQTDQSISRLESRLLSQISGIIPQINSALTQYYKVAVELQARIKKLESDLGVGGEHFMGTELDLEKIQVKMEHVDFDDVDNAGNAEHNARDAGPKRKRTRTFKDPKDYSDSPDLDPVKKSIHEGKPEREAVTHWIQAMQAKHPELSFSDMARILDHAGVPTLSARKGWNRGTLRSLLMEQQQSEPD